MPGPVEIRLLRFRQGGQPELVRRPSSVIRCRPSSWVQGSSPVRTRFMLGRSRRAMPRQTRPSRSSALSPASASTSRATAVRQSTTVPNTSKTSAFTARRSDAAAVNLHQRFPRECSGPRREPTMAAAPARSAVRQRWLSACVLLQPPHNATMRRLAAFLVLVVPPPVPAGPRWSRRRWCCSGGRIITVDEARPEAQALAARGGPHCGDRLGRGSAALNRPADRGHRLAG